jgi:hypothetical protein
MKAVLFYFLLAAGFLGADESLIYLNEILREVEKDLDDNYRNVIDGSLLLPDDPANYLLYEHLETHLKELEVKLSNMSDLLGYYRMVEGILTIMIDTLQEIRGLCLKKTNPIFSDFERSIIDSEIEGLYSHILFSLKTAEFNTIKIFTSLLEDETMGDLFDSSNYYLLENVDSLIELFIMQQAIYGSYSRILEQKTGRGIQGPVIDTDMNMEITELRKNHLLLLINLLQLR